MKSMLGTWLEDKRAATGMTKGQMSEKIGIVVGQYSAYVNGKSIPRKITLEKISKAFKISEDKLREMMNTPAPIADAPSTEEIEVEVPAPVEVPDIQSQLAAAQNKVLEGKIDLVIALLTDVSNRLTK